MKIAIASGKGGAGKTTIAAALTATAAEQHPRAAYLDCDVEAPNGHLLLKPDLARRSPVERLVPVVDAARCDGCGACERACQFGAIVCIGDRAQVHANLCKSCGACVRACPQRAIGETAETIGMVETGHAGTLRFAHGVLNVGQARCIPVIDAVKATIAADELVVVDSPPGTSCPMVAAVRDADRIILVAEPTPFGLADLTLTVQVIASLDRPAAVVVNRCDLGDRRVHDFCRQRGLPIIAELPQSTALARAYAAADLPGIRQAMGMVPQRLLAWAGQDELRSAS